MRVRCNEDVLNLMELTLYRINPNKISNRNNILFSLLLNLWLF